MTSSGDRKIIKNHHSKRYFKENIFDCAVTSVPADGEAPIEIQLLMVQVMGWRQTGGELL